MSKLLTELFEGVKKKPLGKEQALIILLLLDGQFLNSYFIAEKLGLDNNIIIRRLNRMQKDGIVQKYMCKDGNVLYALHEKFFKTSSCLNCDIHILDQLKWSDMQYRVDKSVAQSFHKPCRNTSCSVFPEHATTRTYLNTLTLLKQACGARESLQESFQPAHKPYLKELGYKVKPVEEWTILDFANYYLDKDAEVNGRRLECEPKYITIKIDLMIKKIKQRKKMDTQRYAKNFMDALFENCWKYPDWRVSPNSLISEPLIYKYFGSTNGQKLNICNEYGLQCKFAKSKGSCKLDDDNEKWICDEEFRAQLK